MKGDSSGMEVQNDDDLLDIEKRRNRKPKDPKKWMAMLPKPIEINYGPETHEKGLQNEPEDLSAKLYKTLKSDD